MYVVNFTQAKALEDTLFDITAKERNINIPEHIAKNIDKNFVQVSKKALQQHAKAPTKGVVSTSRITNITSQGVSGSVQPATYDEVLYFARTGISQEEYDWGKEHLGLPMGAWIVLTSKDNKLLFLKKQGAEGAYSNNPYSAFGVLVSAQKDTVNDKISMQSVLERSIAKEAGESIWERRIGCDYMGVNSFDSNKGTVNSGYDIVWKVPIDAPMHTIVSLLEDNPQFKEKSFHYISSHPRVLEDFASHNNLTPSGLSGLLCYTGAVFGADEVQKSSSLLHKKMDEYSFKEL